MPDAGCGPTVVSGTGRMLIAGPRRQRAVLDEYVIHDSIPPRPRRPTSWRRGYSGILGASA